jgi:hypothetical protein
MMTWDAGSGQLRCDHCGAGRAVDDRAAIVEHDLASGLGRSKRRGRLGAGAREVSCQECGATVELPEGVTATRCSFCDSPQVVGADARADHFVPESLVPFAVGRDQAVAAFKGWVGKLWFRPSDLRHKASVSDLRGVYVPWWTFDTQVSSRWTADAGYHYWVEETTTDAQGKPQTRRVQRTRWEPASGWREDHYDDHLVCASKGLPDKLARQVASFDTGALVGYAPDYLMGFAAESYAVELNDAWQRARADLASMQESRCRADIPGDTNRNLRANHGYSDTRFKHVLLPVWVAAFRYQDKIFRFLVNGQNGRVSGEAPLSWLKILLFVVAVAAAIAALVLFLRR